jgi:hypothetical protein
MSDDKKTTPAKDEKPEYDPKFMRVVKRFLKTPPKPHKNEETIRNKKKDPSRKKGD